jgi:hypothetical protein
MGWKRDSDVEEVGFWDMTGVASAEDRSAVKGAGQVLGIS